MKTKIIKTLSFLAFSLNSLLFNAIGQSDGIYSVSESWSVTLYRGADDVTTTYTGTETGTLVITNGGYSQINHTGASLPARLNLSRTIYYDGNFYNISGVYPFSAEGGGAGVLYAVMQFSFFVIVVPLGTEADVPSPYPFDSSIFTSTGTSLTSLSGAGTMVDEAAGFGPVGPSYFINEVDDSSTASLNYLAPLPTGALQVTITPDGAVGAGAQWQVDGGSFQSSGATIPDLLTGSHTVSFSSISGWETPSNQIISISANSTTSATGDYVAIPQTGSLQATILPSSAIAAGAEWQVDGGPWQNSGATVHDLSVGNHTIAFNIIGGWTTPAPQTVSVSNNLTTTAGGTYVAILPLQATTLALPNGADGVVYSRQLSAANGQMPYRWSILSGSLPSGLGLAANGLISGTPTNDGVFNFIVEVTDAVSVTASQSLTLTVGGPPMVTIAPTSISVPIGGNAAFFTSVSGTGPFNYQWRLNEINLPNGIIFTVAGNGPSYPATGSYSGDGGAATNAELQGPEGLAMDAAGNIFIADSLNARIRKVATNGIISTVAGNGEYGYSGDGGAATNAELWQPSDVAVDAVGNLFIADIMNQDVRRVGTNGIISTVAGNETYGYSGDGGAATNAQLYWPSGVAVDATGNLFIVDGQRIRKVETNGIITTVAGNGAIGYAGDGHAATNAEFADPGGVAVDAAGNLFIADTYNNRIREAGVNGIITTVAGNGLASYSGDGGAATNATLYYPGGVSVDATGNLFIADTYNNRIREVGVNGIIATVAGNGTGGYFGDGGAASNAELNEPAGVALDATGNLFIADSLNNRVRKVAIQGPALALNPVASVNAGAYDVVVSTPYGSVTSSVVNLTVTLPVFNLLAPQISGAMTDFTFLLAGPSGGSYVLQVSTNLLNWNSFSTSSIPAGGIIMLTNAIRGYKQSFYRAYQQ